MTPTGSSSQGKAATEAWRLLFTFFIRSKHQRDSVLQQFGLTPNEVRALGDLDMKHGRPMRSLADDWGTDASNATWVIDRLEKQGYAERRAQPGDRRVKLVVLTPEGAKTKTAVMKAMFKAPTAMAALSLADLQTLTALLQKLLAAFTDSESERPTRDSRVPRHTRHTDSADPTD